MRYSRTSRAIRELIPPRWAGSPLADRARVPVADKCRSAPRPGARAGTIRGGRPAHTRPTPRSQIGSARTSQVRTHRDVGVGGNGSVAGFPSGSPETSSLSNHHSAAPRIPADPDQAAVVALSITFATISTTAAPRNADRGPVEPGGGPLSCSGYCRPRPTCPTSARRAATPPGRRGWGRPRRCSCKIPDRGAEPARRWCRRLAPGARARPEQPVRRTPHGGRAAVEDMRVDHRRRHIGVSEQVLHGADVVAVFEQVGGEAVSEGVAGGAFAESRGDDGLVDGVLQDRLVEMVPGGLAGFGVQVGAGRGEDPLPRPGLFRAAELVVQGVWELDPTGVASAIGLVGISPSGEVALQRGDDDGGQRRGAVLVALAFSNGDLMALEVDVLHAHAAALHQAQAGAVQGRGHHLRYAAHVSDDARDFVAAHHRRQPLRPTCAHAVPRIVHRPGAPRVAHVRPEIDFMARVSVTRPS